MSQSIISRISSFRVTLGLAETKQKKTVILQPYNPWGGGGGVL